MTTTVASSLSGFLLDKSFLSALGDSGRPSYRTALRWYQTRDERELFTCAVVIGEIARDIARLETGRRRERYRHWLRHEVLPTFGERVSFRSTSRPPCNGAP